MIVQAAREKKRWTGYLICAFGFGLTVAAFYPGMMSPDSIASLGEGRSGMITEQNSAVMSFVWGILDGVIAGPGPMLILQSAMLWGAAALLWESLFRESFALGVAAALVPFLPHVLSQVPVIWKDVLMATSLFAAVALVFTGKKKESRLAFVLSAPFLLVGLAARLNSLPAVLPIAVWSAVVASSILDMRISRLTTFAAGMVYLVVLVATALGFQSFVTGGRSAYPFQYVQLYDLAAISISAGESRFPGYVSSADAFSMDSVRANYTPTTVGPLVYTDQVRAGGSPPLAVTDDAGRISGLGETWRAEIVREPSAYLAHRAAVFGQLIGLGRSVSLQYWDLGLTRNPAEFPIEKNLANGAITKYLAAFQRPVPQTLFFRAIVWIVACFFLAYCALRSKISGDWDIVFVLSASSLLYIFAYFFTAPAADFRYVYWPGIATTVAAIIGIYLVRRSKGLRMAEV
ncbi:MAG TPA: hypothetical protein VNA22_04090 [Pyrinomonadaceae bacterium]|nr:hypothetical protein [Pyrinomonadaceae bacterium]